MVLLLENQPQVGTAAKMNVQVISCGFVIKLEIFLTEGDLSKTLFAFLFVTYFLFECNIKLIQLIHISEFQVKSLKSLN